MSSISSYKMEGESKVMNYREKSLQSFIDGKPIDKEEMLHNGQIVVEALELKIKELTYDIDNMDFAEETENWENAYSDLQLYVGLRALLDSHDALLEYVQNMNIIS